MKAKLYDNNRVIKVVDCNDVDNICNSCDRYTNYVEVHMRDHSTDRWEVANLLKAAVDRGGNTDLQEQHIYDIHDMLGTNRRYE